MRWHEAHYDNGMNGNGMDGMNGMASAGRASIRPRHHAVMPLCRHAVVVALQVAMIPSPARAQASDTAHAPTIDTVIVITHDVFDEREARGNSLFAVANAIRFKTRPEIVRRELLFAPGDRYDAARIAETERNLRRLGLFRDVSIDTTRLGERLAVQVETRDGWSTQLQLNGRSTGGEFTWSVGLVERNFLGTGMLWGVSYRDDPDRTAVTLRTRVNRLFGTRTQLDGSFEDRSDGTVGAWVVGMPFRAFEDRSAWRLIGEAGRQRVLQFRDGDTENPRVFQRRVFHPQVLLATAPQATPAGYTRVALVAQLKREEYVAAADTLLSISDTVTGAVGLAVERLASRFKVVTHYNGFAREEDIDLSTWAALAVWLAPRAFGYPRGGIAPSLEAQTGASLGRSFARLQIHTNGLFTSAGLDSGQVTANLTLASQPFARQATVLFVEAGARRGTPPGSEFDLGHGVGPRGFGSHAFTGDRMAWGTLEHRWFALDEVWGLLGLGFAAFVDYGGAWYADQPARVGGNVGAGLRLGATRATGANVGRVDLAYRFGEGWADKRWVVSLGRSYAF